jgi:hypothetical protein
MVKLEGAWYCPLHALLLMADALVLLRRGDDWEAIGEVIADLPGILSKVDPMSKQRE